MNSSPIRQLPANSIGKDYVVGDLHGCFDLLAQLMEHVCFDNTGDRLFSVGDLIDRGPDSLRCLELLAEPWFYAVQGNHELMMLEFFLPYLIDGKLECLEDISDTGFLDYGGDWVKRFFQDDQHCMTTEFNRCLTRVLDLPLLWVVGKEESRFHVIHAELVKPDYRNSHQNVWLDNDIDRWLENHSIPADIQENLTWGRTLMLSHLVESENFKKQPGLSTTFCGHTYATRPRQVLSHLCVDTGAFVSLDTNGRSAGYGLTLFDVQTSGWISAAYGKSGMTEGVFA